MDPLAEKYFGWSPYNYTLNNPINFYDPDGRGVDPKTKLTTWKDVSNTWNQSMTEAANAPIMERAGLFIIGVFKTLGTAIDASDPLGAFGTVNPVGIFTAAGEKMALQMLREGQIVTKGEKLFAGSEAINALGKELNFSKLKGVVKSENPATWGGELTGGVQRIVKYVDKDGQTISVVHEVTDAKGNIIHRDFDAVRTKSGEMINKDRNLDLIDNK